MGSPRTGWWTTIPVRRSGSRCVSSPSGRIRASRRRVWRSIAAAPCTPSRRCASCASRARRTRCSCCSVATRRRRCGRGDRPRRCCRWRWSRWPSATSGAGPRSSSAWGRCARRSGCASSTCRGSTSRPRWCGCGRTRGGRSGTWFRTRWRTTWNRSRCTAPPRRVRSHERAGPSFGRSVRRGSLGAHAFGRVRPQGRRHPGARRARDGELHRFLRDLLRSLGAPGEGDPRRGARVPEGRRRAAAPGRGRARGALGADGLPRRGRPRLHARRARVLPAGAALGRGTFARGGLSGLGLLPSETRTSVRVVLTTNQKGAIAEAAIACAATKLGFGVLKPLADGERYDLVLDLRPRLVRVQCKWAVKRGGVVEVRTGTNRRGPDGFIRTTYCADEIDAIAAYCESLDRCYLLSISLAAGRSAFYLRL